MKYLIWQTGTHTQSPLAFRSFSINVNLFCFICSELLTDVFAVFVVFFAPNQFNSMLADCNSLVANSQLHHDPSVVWINTFNLQHVNERSYLEKTIHRHKTGGCVILVLLFQEITACQQVRAFQINSTLPYRSLCAPDSTSTQPPGPITSSSSFARSSPGFGGR